MRIKDTDSSINRVVQQLFARERELRQAVKTRGNMLTMFFHELLIHFSGILIQREYQSTSGSEPTFPYVNHAYGTHPYTYDFSKNRSTHKNNRLSAVLHRMRVLPVARGEAIPFGHKQDRLQSIFVNALTAHQGPETGFVSRLSLQVDALESLIREICLEQMINGADTVVTNWSQYVRTHCSPQQVKVAAERLIIGNRQNLQNRKLAQNYIEQNKEVIAFTHGEISSTVFTEPMYDYAERGLCTHLVDYGNVKQPKRANILLPPQRISSRSSSIARSVFSHSEEITGKQFTNAKTLYVPTTYVGDYIYGPSHAYHDSVYQEWHQAIGSVIPSVVFKTHPKSKATFPFLFNTDRRWLDDCISEYDIYILDYFATSTVRACLTDKPIIYFDIGLRPLTETFIRVLKKRCFYWKIDINGNLKEQLNEALTRFQTPGNCWSNMDIAEYCIASPQTLSWREILIGAGAKSY
jgi:hypothetical protein